MKHLFGILLLSFALMFTACHDDIDEAGSSSTQLPTPKVTKIVEGDVLGLVIDETGAPVVDAVASYDGQTFTTDDQGVFSLRDVEMSSSGTYISVDKDGFFHNSVRLYPTQNGTTQYPVFKMLTMDIAGTIDAAAGGQIDVIGGGTVNFPADAIATQNGQPYSGQVNVSAKWLDPTADDLYETMPGNLEAMSADGENVALATFGMVAVELRDGSGNELDVAEGKQAEIRFPVPSQLQANAPSEIPLWYFDEVDGIWREEGSATLQGNEYVGAVSHFSFWNCDAPFPLVTIEGMIMDEEGNPIQGERIRIRVDGMSRVGYGITDENGKFSGKVPKGEELILEIVDNCGNVAYTQNLGTFDMDAVIPSITIVPTGGTTNIINISGSVEDCNGDPVTNGYAFIEYGNTYRTVVLEADATFSLNLLVCDNPDIEIYAVNLDDKEQSDATTYTSGGDINTGVLVTCTAIVGEFLTITVDGDEMFFPDPLPSAGIEGSMGGSKDGFFFMNAEIDSVNFFNIGVEDIDGAGNYETNFFTYSHGKLIGTPTYFSNCQSGPSPQCSFDTFELTEVGNVGEYIIGNFSGTFEYNISGSIQTVPVTGEFQVTRDF